jgi:hypothetical protein
LTYQDEEGGLSGNERLLHISEEGARRVDRFARACMNSESPVKQRKRETTTRPAPLMTGFRLSEARSTGRLPRAFLKFALAPAHHQETSVSESALVTRVGVGHGTIVDEQLYNDIPVLLHCEMQWRAC